MDAAALEELLAFDEAHGNRLPVKQVLQQRIEQVRAGAVPSPGEVVGTGPVPRLPRDSGPEDQSAVARGRLRSEHLCWDAWGSVPGVNAGVRPADGVAAGKGVSKVRLQMWRVRGFAALGPAEQDHWPALRMALGVGIPTVALLLAGRSDLVIDAVFGGFTGMYGRGANRATRLWHQSFAGALLVAGVGLGSALSAIESPQWALVLGEAVFAGIASLVADKAGFRPQGPFFPLFAFGACAALNHADAVVAIAVALGSALFALAIGASSPRAAARPTAPLRSVRPSLRNAAGYAIAVAASGLAALAIGIGHPHWAMAGAAVPLSAAGVRGRLRRGAHRVVGTLAGLCLTGAILAFHPSPLLMGVLVVALQFPTELFMARHYALALFFFTPLILLMTRLALPGTAESMIADRAVETVLGVLVGFAVVLLDARLGRDVRATPLPN